MKAQLHGDAARTVAGLPLTELNYEHSIALLNQPHKLVAAHMQVLLEPKPTGTLNSLRVFHDTIESHTRGLSSLGKSEISYGEIIINSGNSRPDLHGGPSRTQHDYHCMVVI